MSRPIILGVSVALFAAVLLALTLGYQGWLNRRRAHRARAARRLGLSDEALRASIDRPPQHGFALWLRQRLDQAGDLRTAQQFLVQTGILTVAGFAATAFFLNGPAKVFGLLLGLVPAVLLRRQAAIRSRQITEQLPDAFDRIGRTLRAGHAFSDALRLASEELSAPLSDELARVVTLQALGVDVRRAMESLAARNPDNFDIRLFVGAVLLNRQTGGNLVEILEQLGETVRERLIFDGKVLALTAEVRLSAWILGALPFAVAAVLLLVQPDYLSPLFASDPGRAMLLFGIGSLTVAALVMRRLAAVEV